MKKIIIVLLLGLFLNASAQKQIHIDSLGFDGKPFDAGLYKDLQAVLANKATRKGQFGIVEYGKFLQKFSAKGKSKSKLVEADSTGKQFSDAEQNFYAFSDGKYLYINHEQQLCRVCVIGRNIVFIQNAIYNNYGLILSPKKEIFWLLDTQTGKKEFLFYNKGLPLLLKANPDLAAQYKKEKVPSLDYVAMIEKDLKYMRLINARTK